MTNPRQEPADGEKWIAAEDVDRLCREMDVALNGEDGAAPQASLCDIAAQVIAQARKATVAADSDAHQMAARLRESDWRDVDETPILKEAANFILTQDARIRELEQEKK
jgi:hypothetical protein